MDHTGNGGFATLVVVFILGTYALALSLESIINQWTLLKKEKWGAKFITRQAAAPHDHESRGPFNVIGGRWGFRRRRLGKSRHDETF